MTHPRVLLIWKSPPKDASFKCTQEQLSQVMNHHTIDDYAKDGRRGEV